MKTIRQREVIVEKIYALRVKQEEDLDDLKLS